MPLIPSKLLSSTVAVCAGAVLLMGGQPLLAQTTATPRVIAYLGGGPSDPERRCMDELRAALEVAGWSFDKQVKIEWNDAGHDPARLAPLAQALVARRPDVLLSTTVAPTEALMQATKTLPIIVIGPGNLDGVVDAQARPLANVTGVVLSLTGQHGIKPLEVLLQAFPGARRIGQIENSGNPLHAKAGEGGLGPVQDMVRRAGAKLFRVHFSGEAGVAGAWEELARLKVDAVMIRPDSPGMLAEHARQSLRLRLPAISHHAWFSNRVGGLLSYGVIGRIDFCGRAAQYVDQVLRGRAVAELPVQELYEAGLSINLDTAEQMGVQLPPAMIARAVRLIRPQVASTPGSVSGKAP
ncbi:ABC transporter substrate-binding protein [Ottowia thiooxydans]|uniref:ABC transport system substrate-binding protein n=1 Tax=Ottowia thiooxydans TaxID=219182 RepID=A0ABV2QFD6_9BURK